MSRWRASPRPSPWVRGQAASARCRDAAARTLCRCQLAAPCPSSHPGLLTPPLPLLRHPPTRGVGKTRRAMGKRSLFHKLKDYKRALVQLQDDKTTIQAPAASAAQQQLR